MRIQSDNISFNGYDARPLKGFLMTSNYRNIAKELQTIGKKQGFDVFILRNSEMMKEIPPDSIREHHVDFWAQDLWTVVGKHLLNNYNEKADKRTEIFKDFFSLQDCPVQTQKRLDLVDWDVTELEKRLYSGIEDDRLLPNFDKYAQIYEDTHIAGGNIFLTKSQSGRNNLLIGEDEIDKFTKEELKKIYNADKICFVPQLDYHLDLFIRPLRDNVVLLSDENLTENLLRKIAFGLNKRISQNQTPGDEDILRIILSHQPGSKKRMETRPAMSNSLAAYYRLAIKRINSCISSHAEYKNNSTAPTVNDVEEALTAGGYKVVRVPGSVHKNELLKYWDIETEGFEKRRYLNYMNACVTVNQNNDIVYITNKDNLLQELNISGEMQKELGADFEEEFRKSVKDYIKPENIYFLKGTGNALGDILLNRQGGLHCVTTEIPMI